MNRFGHGVEVLYSRNASAVTEAVGISGLRLLVYTLPGAVKLPLDTGALGQAQIGVIIMSHGSIVAPVIRRTTLSTESQISSGTMTFSRAPLTASSPCMLFDGGLSAV